MIDRSAQPDKKILKPFAASFIVIAFVVTFGIGPLVFSAPESAGAESIEKQEHAIISVDVTHDSRDSYQTVRTPSYSNIVSALADPNSPQSFAYQLVEQRGWEVSEFSCLYNLWQRESNWRVNAENKSSGAYGIPQALPGSKMQTVGDDWRTNFKTQITWGIQYVKSRYGTPCGAWDHFGRKGWY